MLDEQTKKDIDETMNLLGVLCIKCARTNYKLLGDLKHVGFGNEMLLESFRRMALSPMDVLSMMITAGTDDFGIDFDAYEELYDEIEKDDEMLRNWGETPEFKPILEESNEESTEKAEGEESESKPESTKEVESEN